MTHAKTIVAAILLTTAVGVAGFVHHETVAQEQSRLESIRAEDEARARQSEAERQRREDEAEALRRRNLEIDKQRAKDKADAQEAKRSEQLAPIAAMTPPQRAKAIADLCRPAAGRCDPELARAAIAAVADPAEAARLTATLDASLEIVGIHAGEERRTQFADKYETTLLQRHMNPDAVTATGQGKRTLHVQGWFCTRQFFFDFTSGPDGAQARSEGFNTLECTNALTSVHGQI